MIPVPEPRERGMATSVDGTRIAWHRYGTAPQAVLFVPTWNIVDARVVGHQVEALQPHATVVTYDARGSGRSDRPERGYDFPLHAADALAVMDATGIDHAAIVTASRGLHAAILLAIDHAERVERIAAIAPYVPLDPPPPPDPARLASWRTDWAGFIGPFMHRVFTEPDSDDLIAEMIPIGMDASPKVAVAQELELDWTRVPRLLDGVRCPTLIIHGEADAPVPLALVQRLADAMPNARLVVVPNGGHRPDIRTPELVNPMLLDFVLDRGAGRPGAGGSVVARL